MNGSRRYEEGALKGNHKNQRRAILDSREFNASALDFGRDCFSVLARDSGRVTVPLQIRLTFPISDERFATPILFDGWLPSDEADAIAVNEKPFSLRFWIDDTCKDPIHHMGLSRVHCDVTGISISEQLARLVLDLSLQENLAPEQIASYDPAVLNQYDDIGRLIYRPALDRFNRLVSYIRAVKGQFWIDEYTPEETVCSSALLKLKARAKVGDSDWVGLTSRASYRYTLECAPRERFIARDDWPNIAKHVSSLSRILLASQLLAGADEFLRAGHLRAAIIEAVCALEATVSSYSKTANSDAWLAALAGRSGANCLHNHIEHLGMNATVSFLLPLLFTEEQLPAATLESCRRAIEIRNNVVHRGQRDIDNKETRACLHAVRHLCDFLSARCKDTVI